MWCRRSLPHMPRGVEDAKEWITYDNCQSETPTTFAQAHASALAKVLAQLLLKAQCSGQGLACRYSVVQRGALVSSVVQALASMFDPILSYSYPPQLSVVALVHFSVAIELPTACQITESALSCTAPINQIDCWQTRRSLGGFPALNQSARRFPTQLTGLSNPKFS